MPVASAEAPILAMLLPSSSAPISRWRISNRLETTSASRLPCLDSRSMLARDAPVSAVSLAAKNADAASSATMMERVSQFMSRCSVSYAKSMIVLQTGSARRANTGPSCRSRLPPVLQKIAHPRGLDIPGDHRTADRFEQDEGQTAAAHLFVLRHQRHQRIGIRQSFLCEACDILQPCRQAHLGEMPGDACGFSGREHAKRGRKLRR